MKAERLYAQVLLDSAGSTAVDSIKSDLAKFEALFVENALLGKVLYSPTIAEDEKQKILKEFSTKLSLSPLVTKFLSLLIKKNRMDILSDITKEIETLQTEKAGGLVGEIVSAVPLESGVASGVAQAISKKLNRPVQLTEKVDPGLIAGMRVTVSGVTYDGSVQNKIEKLVGSFH